MQATPPAQDETTDRSPVRDDELLWRRILREQLKWSEDEQRWKISDGAFKDTRLSVYRAALTTVEWVMREAKPASNLGELSAQLIRSCGCLIEPDYVPGEPGHAEIAPPPTIQGRYIPGKCAKLMARVARLLLPLPELN